MRRFFQLQARCSQTSARAGVLTTPHGDVPTPVFMPVGSQATVRALDPRDLEALKVNMILANTYHLYLRPGISLIGESGGLHEFMGWPGPILTDSGGYQVFSLGHLTQTSDKGALFRSHIDGSEHFFTPELAIAAQEELDADIMMAFDECPAYGQDRAAIERSMRRTHLWAARSKQARKDRSRALFGIVQGGTFPDLRLESAGFLKGLEFEGYSVGGLSLGEPKDLMFLILESTLRALPLDKPRYLMGVGSPEDIVESVGHGVDMFDSALPTRLARNGALFTRTRRLNIMNARFARERGPVDPDCDCYTCRTFSSAYIHHLFKSRELVSYRLATLHNVRFVMRLMAEIRESIIQGNFASFRDEFLAGYEPTDAEARIEEKQKWLDTRQASESGP